MTLLDVQALSAGYGDAPVASEISFAVGTAAIVALLGPNGAGKSTILKAIVGEARVLAGTVKLRGTDVTAATPERLAKLGVGYVPQSDNVFPSLSVEENLEMGAYLVRRREIAERIAKIVDDFPVLRPLMRREVSRLSGGERRLVAIGRALVLRPEILLLDEPTANLSPANASRVLREYVSKVAAGGTGVLLVEQRAKEALEVASEACVLSGGRLVVSGSPESLVERGDIGRLFLGETGERAAAKGGR